ncbi:MAG TPA: rod-binding protein [Allosphingosinicella sp.]|nr:rod-binding protein [Allosphingosinicella sp.]
MINSLNSQAPATGGDAAAQRRQELRQAAQAFEAVFIRQLIGSMRNAKLGEDMFGSQATEQFRDMADARLADSMSQQGTFGIADMLAAQFERQQAGIRPAQAGAQVEQAAAAAEAARTSSTAQPSNEVTR